MLLIDKHKLKQKCNNFGYLSTQFWLKGNDKGILGSNKLKHIELPHLNIILESYELVL